MITVITGTPGAGKTALAVSMLLEEQGKRPLFVSGIPDLKIDHQPTPPVEEWTREEPTPEDETVKRPIFNFPANSIIVIDEAQNVYRPRGVGSKVPPHVAAFETHRHTGVDFWLITQHPGLLDANIRKLVGRHVHIRNTPLGRYLYEWPECGDPETKSSRDISASRRYKLPKKVYGLYKSASLHVKQKHRVPFAFYILAAAVLFVGFLGYRTYSRIQDVAGGNPFGKDGPQALSANGQHGTPAVPGQPAAPVDPFAQYKPTVPDLAFTAPRYQGITQPVTAPIPAACVSTAKDCRCYTQQATRLNLSADLCRQIVANGFFVDFDSRSVNQRSDSAEKPHQGTERPAQSIQQPPQQVMSPETVRVASAASDRFDRSGQSVLTFDRELYGR